MVKKFVYIISSLEFFSLGLMLPMIGMQIVNVGGNRFILGLLSSAMCLLQFITGPLFGSWSDSVGTKPALLVSGYGLLIGKLIFANPTLYCYIIGRLIHACFVHGQILTRTLLAQSKEADQAAVENKLRAYAALAFTLAPVIGGYIMTLNEGFFKLSILLIALEVVNVVACHCIPTIITTSADEKSKKSDEKSKTENGELPKKPKKKSSAFQQVVCNLRAVNWNIFGTLFFFRFLVETAISIFTQNLGYVFAQVFKCSPTEVGLIISLFGVCSIVVNIMMKTLKTFFPDGYRHGTIGMLTAFTIAYLLPYYWVYIGFMMVFSIFKPLLEDSWTRSIIEMADEKNKGAVNGAFQSLVQLSGFIAPLVNGYIGEVYGYSSTVMLSCCISMIAVATSYRLVQPKTKTE